MASCTGLAHCKVALAFAVIFDLVGVMVLLAGVFVPLEVKGRDFGDLLVYTGVILVLISLGGWVMWYSGNIEGLATSKEMGHIGNAVDRIAHTQQKNAHPPRPSGSLKQIGRSFTQAA